MEGLALWLAYGKYSISLTAVIIFSIAILLGRALESFIEQATLEVGAQIWGGRIRICLFEEAKVHSRQR